MRPNYCHKVMNDIKISNKLEFPIHIQCLPVNYPRRVRIYQPPLQNIRKTSNPGWTRWNSFTMWHWRIFSSLILSSDKIVFHLTMPLNVIRSKNKIPVFPAKAGKILRFFSFSSKFWQRLIFQLELTPWSKFHTPTCPLKSSHTPLTATRPSTQTTNR